MPRCVLCFRTAEGNYLSQFFSVVVSLPAFIFAASKNIYSLLKNKNHGSISW
jgi:hypothetical protein